MEYDAYQRAANQDKTEDSQVRHGPEGKARVYEELVLLSSRRAAILLFFVCAIALYALYLIRFDMALKLNSHARLVEVSNNIPPFSPYSTALSLYKFKKKGYENTEKGSRELRVSLLNPTTFLVDSFRTHFGRKDFNKEYIPVL